MSLTKPSSPHFRSLRWASRYSLILACLFAWLASASAQIPRPLSVLTRVISRRSPAGAVLDVGVKGAGHEFGLPEIKGHPDVEIPFFKSEEHCVLNDTPDWQIGQTLELIPSHACTTCNLYRQVHVHEDGQIVDVWPIEASGMLT